MANENPTVTKEVVALARLTEHMNNNFETLPTDVKASYATFINERINGENKSAEAEAFNNFIASATKSNTQLPQGTMDLINDYKETRTDAPQPTASYDYANVGNVDAYGNVTKPDTHHHEKPEHSFLNDILGSNQKGNETGDPFLDLFLACVFTYLKAYEEERKRTEEDMRQAEEASKKTLAEQKEALANGEYNQLYTDKDYVAAGVGNPNIVGAEYDGKFSDGAKEIINARMEEVREQLAKMGYNVQKYDIAEATKTEPSKATSKSTSNEAITQLTVAEMRALQNRNFHA